MAKAASDARDPSMPASGNPNPRRSWRPSAGVRVGKYRVLSELGRGGTANVYLAVAQGPGGVNKLVVLKALLPELASESDSLTMFLDEARIAAQLNHPNVVQTYEVGAEGDRHVMVMEYLEGQSYSAVVKRSDLVGRALPLELELHIILCALEGLGYAHDLAAYDGTPLELVHRDVSPHNVFVTYDGQVKVLDFGIAKAASSSTHTATGVIKGKLAYMAPEQIAASDVDRRADLYSIGCMLWAAAAKRKLWKDTPDVQIMRRVMQGDVPTPQSVNPRCDDELNRIVMKALAWQREERHASALELQQDIAAYCERHTREVRQKDLATYVSTLFADTRAELKALVERRLSLATNEESISAPVGMVLPRASEASRSGRARHDRQPAGVEGGSAREPSAAGRSLAVGGALAVVLGAWLLFAARLSGRPPLAGLAWWPVQAVQAPPAAPAPVATAAGAARAPDERGALPELVIRHEVTPPAASATASAGAPPALVHAKVRRKLAAQRPTTLATPTPVNATTEPAKSSERKVNCDEPFYLAPDGTRRLRPECK